MSDRFYVKRTDGKEMQLFGNNIFPATVRKKLEEQGIAYDEDGFFYDFRIMELQSLVEGVKEYIVERHNQYEENKELYRKLNDRNGVSIADFTSDCVNRDGSLDAKFLYMNCACLIEKGVIFTLYNLIEFLKDDIDWKTSVRWSETFVLKETAKVCVSFR